MSSYRRARRHWQRWVRYSEQTDLTGDRCVTATRGFLNAYDRLVCAYRKRPGRGLPL